MCGRESGSPVLKRALEKGPTKLSILEKGLRNLWDQLPQILDKETGLNVKVLEVIQLVNKTSVPLYGAATITIISVITTDPF